MVDHADVGSCVGSVRSHGVGEESSAKSYASAFCGDIFDEGGNIVVTDGSFDKHGWRECICEHSGKFLNMA